MIIGYNLRKIKIHEIGAAEYMSSVKHLKSKIWQLCSKITQKSASKDLTKSSPTYFSRTFLQHFLNRPSPNIKIILA